ncbi:LysR family transcriptional regulator [bacterium]|nr:LysR family transcriptional regulator [bacterium]
MRFRQFEVFYAVMTTGSVTGAANLLDVSQPSVSKTLQQLEGDLGYALFDRVRGRLQPTEEARSLMRDAERTRAAMNDLREASRRLRRGAQSHLRIVTTPALGHEVLPDAVTAFARRWPDVQLTISTRHSGEVLDEISKPAFGFDLGLVFDASSRPASVGAQEIGEAPIALVASAKVFARPGTEVRLEDLAGRPVIGLALRSTVRVQTYRLACALALRDVGVAVVDGVTAASVMRDEPTADVRLFPADMKLPVNAVYPLSLGLPMMSREFVELFRQALDAQNKGLVEGLQRRGRAPGRNSGK